ncbi:ABC transporter substrate-binding protein [Arenibaculum pallidiluteum]|uniref:ABC transporter substrate-binding protein n=1 Tax=Arenibaculum pallidiluteum TaxID=2812559 RepID=UPI001A97CF86|nr:ABC transporter substrate-binding protein [Arenibaculum pallidiluteum]
MNVKGVALAGVLAAMGGLAAAEAQAQGKLTLYCSVQEEWCQLMVNEFQKKTGIQVAMTRKSSGETYAQIKAEAANPKGDVWWGGTGDPHLQAAEEELTMPYESPLLKELHPWAAAQHGIAGGRTVGIYLGALGYGYNTETLAKKNLPAPKCWADLAKPEYKGEVQVANPNASGTAYTFIATLVQLWGEDKAFAYLKQLNGNVNQYTKSGAAPAQAAGRGETLIGIAFLHDVITPAIKGLPVAAVPPCEGTGFEIGSMSIIDGARNLENAKKWYDWALSAEAQALGAQAASYQNPSHRAAPIPAQAPKMDQIKLIDYDFKKFGSSDERKRLLARWDAEIKVLGN